MAQVYEYALMSASAYQQNRKSRNHVFPAPDWQPLSLPGYPDGHAYDAESSFEAVVYRKGNEIVIAYTGTDEKQDWWTNLGAGSGIWLPDQAKKVAEFYAMVTKQYGGDGINISFTGHSLGGTNGPDVLDGTLGGTILTGSGGDDTLIGGPGPLVNLDGGAGSDVYVFGRGDGRDTLDQSDAGGDDVDTVRLGADVTTIEVSVAHSGDNLVLLIGNAGNGLQLSNWFDQATPVSRVEFADGTIWNSEALMDLAAESRLIIGTPDDDDTVDDGIVKYSGKLLGRRESRRWRDGERNLRAANNAAWRRLA